METNSNAVDNYEHLSHAYLNNSQGTNISRFLLCLYFAISIFEPYLNGVLGSLTKLYIFFVMFVLLVRFKYFNIRKIQIVYLIWLAYKFISLLWSQDYSTPKLHYVSQIGMVVFLCVLISNNIDKKMLDSIKVTYWVSSGILGFLSLLFSQSYRGYATARQVVVLFGVEADPNNTAALLLVGVGISLYYLFCERKHILVSFIILSVNVLACFKSASRAGLVAIIVLLVFSSLAGSINKKSLFKWARLMLLLAVISGIMYYLATHFLSTESFTRLFELDGYEGGSERDILWSNAWKFYTQDLLSILMGTGWGSVTINTGLTIAVHNTFLTMLCDVGLFGFLIFFTPVIYASYKLLKSKNAFPAIMVLSGMIPSFFIDAINKRFFWNAIFILFIYYYNMVSDQAPQKEKK